MKILAIVIFKLIHFFLNEPLASPTILEAPGHSSGRGYLRRGKADRGVWTSHDPSPPQIPTPAPRCSFCGSQPH